MDYYAKYLKYKAKYLDLKAKLYGGNRKVTFVTEATCNKKPPHNCKDGCEWSNTKDNCIKTQCNMIEDINNCSIMYCKKDKNKCIKKEIE